MKKCDVILSVIWYESEQDKKWTIGDELSFLGVWLGCLGQTELGFKWDSGNAVKKEKAATVYK